MENGLTIGYLAQTTFSDDNAIVKEELQKAFGPLKKDGTGFTEIK